MTATERVRELLDERGVEWKAWDGAHPITVWHDETYLYEFIEYRLVNGAKQVSNCPSDNDGHCELTIKVFNCTPEQAIAATLGQESDDAAMVKLHDQMNAAMLEYEMAQGIEKRDGDEAIVVPWVAKMHALLEEAAALGSCNCSNNCTNGERTRTCTADETDAMECVCDQVGRYGKRVTIHVMECSECGRTYEHVNGGYEFCPRCGRRIEVNDG